jgi:putative ABC transport system permease protein
MQSIWKDFRYATRGLRNQPGFVALAALTLALGIGSATIIFSIIQNVLLDPLPYAHADQIFVFQIRDLNSTRPGGRSWFEVAEFLDYQTQVSAFDEVFGDTDEDILYATGDGTERLRGVLVSGNTFRMLDVSAAYGRVLTPDDAKPGAPRVFVMSHTMWARQFGLDPAIIGRSFVLNGVPTTLVGIMPPRFAKRGADLWLPAPFDRADPQDSQRFYTLQARLKPGVTRAQAEAEFQVVADRLARVYPRNYPKKFAVTAVSWIDSVVGSFRTTLYTMAAAVALLLLIACGNVANMLLARAHAREKEIAIRASLGATRVRLVRQLLIESLLLALLGAGAGCVLASLGLEVLVRAIPEGLIPPETVIRVNLPVLGFSLAAAVLTALLFGLVPALQLARRDLVEPLKDSGKGASSGGRRGRLSGVLVIVEVALSLVLLAGAGLLMRSFVRLQTVDLGMNVDHVLYARLQLPPGQYRTADANQQLFTQVLQRLNAMPGVVSAAITSSLPPYGGVKTAIDLPAQKTGNVGNAPSFTLVHLCSDGYFRTFERRLLRGRLLSDADVNDGRKVAVVNETLATRYFGPDDPIGKTVKLTALQTLRSGAVEQPIFEIVGVIADARNIGLRDPALPESFIPFPVTPAFERLLFVRTAGSPLLLLNNLRREVWTVDRNLAFAQAGALTDVLTRFSYAEPRFGLVVMSVFAGMGLLLVTLGVYSVIAYTVSRQTHEIGMRIALGATRGDVQRMVLRDTLRLIGPGIVAGLLASFAATGVLASQLFGVTAHDPFTLTLVVIVVAIAGVAACYVPARRATRVDPIVALRCE